MDCEKTGDLICPSNVDILTGRAGEGVEALSDRKVDVACIQKIVPKKD